MTATRDRARLHSDGGFDGRLLLSEQTKLLLESTPADINCIQFLKLRLSAQQRATAQRNYWQRVQREGADSVNSSMPRSQGQGGILASGSSISAPVDGSGVSASAIRGGEASLTHAGDDRRSWRATGSVDGASVSTCDAERAMPEHSTMSLPNLSKHDTAVWSAPYSSASPSTMHQHFVEDMPAAVWKRRGTSSPEAADLVAAPTAESSEDGSSSQRRPSCPLPEEDVYVVAPLTANDYSAAAAAAIDERPATACGKPQVPPGVDEMEDVPLEPCPHCGRTFAPGPLQRHVTTCERQKGAALKMKSEVKGSKVASARKKPVRSATAGDPAAASVAASAGAAGPALGGSQCWPSDAALKPEKWRKQSARLRNAMAGASLTVADDRVQCPSCGRRFSDDVAERHIPICKSKGIRGA
ncbi:hypothetical protein LSCM1_04316 [Leishmania martiniquensis]|uniref:C2HC/C3H-type domain-containing protein n=1 Tax=Leishmania martiniquensis TaxID=1580590 RepID=A0A836KEW9_9TRYP|nr:hypothetical protein LSCM1_04316 [Leishmania martiniquensis]